jgi:hypothetical protein
MKKQTKIKKLRVSVMTMLFALLAGLGFAQTSMPHPGGSATQTITPNPNRTFLGLSVQSRTGDVSASVSGTTVTINSTGYGTGSVTVRATYQKNPNEVNMPDDSICGRMTTHEDHVFSFCKTFSIQNVEIKGASCVRTGDTITFSAQGNNDVSYEWLYIPGDWQRTNISKQGDFVTYKIGATIPPTIGVKAGGTCNTDPGAIVTKDIEAAAVMPTLRSDHSACLTGDQRQIRVEFERPNFPFKWRLSNHDWQIVDTGGNANEIYVDVNVGVSAGFVVLEVDGGCSSDFVAVDIIRSIDPSAFQISGDKCVVEGKTINFGVYPAPNQKVTWEFPDNWDLDGFNENSSNRSVKPRANTAESGWIRARATHAPCSSSYIEMWVDIAPHEPKPINIVGENGNCLRIGTSYTFTSISVKHGKTYKWVFPEGWIHNGNPIAEHTVEQQTAGQSLEIIATPTIEAGAGEIRLYVYGHGDCNNAQYVSYAVNFVPLAIGDIVSDREGMCINLGMEDMIGYRVPTQRSVLYDWTIPNGWKIQDNDSVWFIRAITDGVRGIGLPISVYSFNECGISSPVFYYQDVVGIEDGINIDKFMLRAAIEEPSEDEFDEWGTPIDVEVGYFPMGYTVVLSPAPSIGYDNLTIQWLENGIEFGYWRDAPYYDWYYDYEYWNTPGSTPKCTMIGTIVSDGRCSSRFEIQVCMPDDIPEPIYYDDLAPAPKSQPANSKALASKNENAINLSVTPNPAKDYIQISLSGTEKASNVFVFDAKGVLVRKFIMNTDFSLDTSNLKPGVYFVKAISGKQKDVKKIVITD